MNSHEHKQIAGLTNNGIILVAIQLVRILIGGYTIGLDQFHFGEGFLETARDFGHLLHALMTEDVNLVGKIANTPHESGNENQGDDRQSPLQIEQKRHTSHESQDVVDGINNGSGKEPAHAFDILGKA